MKSYFVVYLVNLYPPLVYYTVCRKCLQKLRMMESNSKGVLGWRGMEGLFEVLVIWFNS